MLRPLVFGGIDYASRSLRCYYTIYYTRCYNNTI